MYLSKNVRTITYTEMRIFYFILSNTVVQHFINKGDKRISRHCNSRNANKWLKTTIIVDTAVQNRKDINL